MLGLQRLLHLTYASQFMTVYVVQVQIRCSKASWNTQLCMYMYMIKLLISVRYPSSATESGLKCSILDRINHWICWYLTALELYSSNTILSSIQPWAYTCVRSVRACFSYFQIAGTTFTVITHLWRRMTSKELHWVQNILSITQWISRNFIYA